MNKRKREKKNTDHAQILNHVGYLKPIYYMAIIPLF